MPPRQLGAAIALTSAGALAYEILLIRLFAIIEFHHLAFLVISLALLGYGASGTIIALARARLVEHFDTAAAAAAAGFGLTSIGAFAAAQRIGLNSLEIFWSTRQLWALFLLYLLFAVPFCCAAGAIGLSLTRFGAESPRLYRADLLGGGVGSVALTALLFLVHPVTALQIVAASGFLAAALYAGRRRGLAAAAIGIALAVAARPLVFPLRVSQFKELSHALRVPRAEVIDERSSPLAMLTAVRSPSAPFRHAPGLSLTYEGGIPAQIGVFTDGGGMTPIIVSRNTEYLDALPTAVPYHVGMVRRRVAVIGTGGGSEVLSAIRHGADEVTAVELNRQMIDLVRARSGVYDDPRVRVVISEGRRFVRDSTESWDAIQLALVGAQGTSAAGVQALSENYLYTVEGLRDLAGHLSPGGLLVITCWMQTPPRDAVKLLATAAVALGPDAGERVALVRGWNTATLLLKNGTLDATELAQLRRFCNERSFDLDWGPGVTRDETNRFNIVAEPWPYDAAAALFRDGRSRDDFIARYKFNVRPATDERPYFFHAFRWRSLPELLRLRARGGIPLLEWGYVVLLIGLVQAFAAAVVIILVPLLLRGRARSRGLVTYFGSIGLAFFFIEIAFMQRLTLLLGNPLYAIALVLSTFLVFAGIGSGVSAKVPSALSRSAPMVAGAMALAVLVVVRNVMALSFGAGIAISVAAIAPLAFTMGMPFPIGLRRLPAEEIPWAWGINGTASVLASMLATLIAVHFGFSVLVLFAAALYALAAAQSLAPANQRLAPGGTSASREKRSTTISGRRWPSSAPVTRRS